MLVCFFSLSFCRNSSSFIVVCSQYTEMLEGNMIAPHKFVRVSFLPVYVCTTSSIYCHGIYSIFQTEMRCQFSLSYISVDEVLPQILTVSVAPWFAPCLCLLLPLHGDNLYVVIIERS